RGADPKCRCPASKSNRTKTLVHTKSRGCSPGATCGGGHSGPGPDTAAPRPTAGHPTCPSSPVAAGSDTRSADPQEAGQQSLGTCSTQETESAPAAAPEARGPLQVSGSLQTRLCPCPSPAGQCRCRCPY